MRLGMPTTLVDRLAPGDSGAASYGNAGSLSWSSCTPVAMPGLMWQVPGWLLRRDGPLTIRWRHLPALAPWLWRFVNTGSVASVEAAAQALSALHSPCTILVPRNLLYHDVEMVRNFRTAEVFSMGYPFEPKRKAPRTWSSSRHAPSLSISPMPRGDSWRCMKICPGLMDDSDGTAMHITMSRDFAKGCQNVCRH